ncbi:RNA helicase [Malassezia vespertilionis]|uniref:RNA helicase n=1 Tax=Malassezia vespertilionis TaxID=2020962 RepID=UPI0024B1171F|nr:RNA helicase [Malassezia vespertilionis]WFD08123.1 RNA helicase [Malassezia vespertilionis]
MHGPKREVAPARHTLSERVVRGAPRAPTPNLDEARRAISRPGELPALEFAQPAPATESARTFDAAPLSAGLLSMVHSLLGPQARPTTPQAQALAHFFPAGAASAPEARSTLIAAETGSGKTLAYLLPMLQKLHATREREHADYAHVDANGEPRIMPRCVILAPTHELVRQINEVAKALSHHPDHKMRVACTSTASWDAMATGVLAKLAARGERASGAPLSPDILVTTPMRLKEMLDPTHRTPISLANVQGIVVDEADTLMDRSFSPDTVRVLNACAGASADTVYVTATIPRSLTKFFDAHVPLLTTLASPNLHLLPPKLTATFVDPGGSKEMAVLKQLFRIFTTPSHDGDQVLIFRDKRHAVQQLSAYLRERNVDHIALTGDDVSRFARTDPGVARFLHRPYARLVHEKDAPRVLITTSLLSRGLDFGAQVRHVFLPDAGHGSTASAHAANNNALELLHRAGRSARAGRTGNVVVFDRASAPGKTKVLINHRGQKKGVVRGHMDLLVRALRSKKSRR